MLFAIRLICSLFINKLTNLVTIHHALVVENFFFCPAAKIAPSAFFLMAAGAVEHSLCLPHARPMSGPESEE